MRYEVTDSDLAREDVTGSFLRNLQAKGVSNQRINQFMYRYSMTDIESFLLYVSMALLPKGLEFDDGVYLEMSKKRKKALFQAFPEIKRLHFALEDLLGSDDSMGAISNLVQRLESSLN